jgi:hypothetical protein
MSMQLNQYIVYGYKSTREQYKELVDVQKEDWDEILAVSSEDGIGWIAGDQAPVFGKIVMEGEDAGKHSLLVAESGVLEVPTLSQAERTEVEIKILEKFPSDEHNHCKYYLVSSWW